MGKKPTIAERDIVVGDVITTQLRGNTALATKRVAHALSAAKKIIHMDVGTYLQQKGCQMVAIPRLQACCMWTRPAAGKLIAIRN